MPSASFCTEFPCSFALPSVYSTFETIEYFAVSCEIPSPSAVLTVRLVFPPPTILSVTFDASDETFSTMPSFNRLPVLSLSVSTKSLLVSHVLDEISIISPT